MDTSELTPKQLRELADQKEREQREILNDIPQMVADPDLTELRKLCQTRIDYAAGKIGRDEFDPEDQDAYVESAAMEAFFGKGVHNWIGRAMRARGEW